MKIKMFALHALIGVGERGGFISCRRKLLTKRRRKPFCNIRTKIPTPSTIL